MSSTAPSWLVNLPPTPKIWFDTDIGNDIDDVLALLWCMHNYGRQNLVGVSTTFYRPDQKARIAKIILSEYDYKEVPVYAGIGIYEPEKDGNLLFNKYGTFPHKRFGLPWSAESLSSKEAQAYRNNFPKFDSIQVSRNGVNELRAAIQKYQKDLILLSLGFHTNLGEVIDDAIKYKVNRIVIMGGWFSDENGGVRRLGYNTVGDLVASKKILEQKEIPVVIVSSQFCSKFAINGKEYKELQAKGSGPGSRGVARAICEDMRTWMEGKNQEGSENKIHIGDPIAAYLSRHPEEITEVECVELELSTYQEGIDMFHAECKNYIKVRKVANSNIVVVKSIKDDEKMRADIVKCISKSFDWKKF